LTETFDVPYGTHLLTRRDVAFVVPCTLCGFVPIRQAIDRLERHLLLLRNGKGGKAAPAPARVWHRGGVSGSKKALFGPREFMDVYTYVRAHA
jgi:hypothetical protein